MRIYSFFFFPFNLQLNAYGWYYGIYNTSNERPNPHWKILTVVRSPCRPPAPSLCYWTLDQFTSVQDSMTSEGCPKTDCKKKKQTTFFPGCYFSASHFLEGGKVIKGFGLEKAFYFNSYWAGVNKDVIKVNNDLINQSRWQCQEEFESKSPLCYRVINPDYK